MPFDGHLLPHVNASLNAVATVLLLAGYVLIKFRREAAHKWTMLACFAVSVAFLGCYLYYHIVVRGGESTKFPTYPPPAIRYFYFTILLTHIVLAAAVPFLALATIWTGLRAEHRPEYRARHRRWAWWTFPIWLYVSITGVVVYLMVYQLYPPL
jgi:putative membrane protein